MNRAMPWVLAAVVVVAGAAAWLLLSGDDGPGAGGAGRSLTADDEAPVAPRFDDPAPARDADRIEPTAVVPPGAPGPVHPRDPTTPLVTGPTRRVTGQVRRLADGSPLSGVQVLPVTGDPSLDLGPRGWDAMRTLDDPDRTAWLSTRARRERQDLTDADGRFEVTDCPVEAEALYVSNIDLMSSFLDKTPRTALVDLPDGTADVLDLEVTLDTGWIAAGSVRDVYGAPVPGALVRARYLLGEDSEAAGEQLVINDRGVLDLRPIETRSAEDGRFRVEDLSVPSTTGDLGEVTEIRESCRLEVLAAGFAYASRDILSPDHAVVVGPVDFVLERAGAIAGWVGNPRGEPLPGARVKVEWAMQDDHGRRPKGPDTGLTGSADEEGRYRVENVPPGRYVVSARAPAEAPEQAGRPGPWVPGVVVTAGATTPLDFVLGAGATLTGRVEDTVGNPIAGVRVELVRAMAWDAPANRGSTVSSHRDGDSWAEVRTNPSADGVPRTVLRTLEDSATTGPDGVYGFEAVSPGAKQLATLGREGERALPVRHEVEVLGVERLDGFDFVLGGGRTLRGRVTDERGIPLEGVHVVVREPDIQIWNVDNGVRTDEHGRFEVTGLPERALRVWFHSALHTDVWEDVAADEPELEVVLEPAHVVRGQVVEVGTGVPIRRFSLAIETESSTTWQNVEDAQGAFEISALSNAACTIRVSATGFLGQTVGDVRPEDTAVTPLRIALPREP